MATSRLGRSLRALALALLPLLVLLLVSEWALAWLGLGDPDEQLSLSRGFDPRARYLVPVDGQPDTWRTQMFGGQGREVTIGPKGEARRVLLVGGSNTAGFPEQELARQLVARDDSHAWEVINLGRPGYGSERVAIIVEQALVLQPDLLLIYAGHNEFVERGFALELLDAGASPWSQRLDLTLSRLRLHNVLADALAPDEDYWTRVARQPEARRERDRRFQAFTYADTLFVFDVYELNLRRMLDSARAAHVGVLLCTVIGNDLMPPMVEGWQAWAEHPDAMAFEAALTRARTSWPARLVDGIIPAVRLRWTDWRDDLVGKRPPSAQADPAARAPMLRELLGELAATPATSGDKMTSVAGAHHGDPRGWTPAVGRVMASVEALCAGDLQAAERDAVSRARAAYDKALALRSDDPAALFERGLCDFVLRQGDHGHDDLLAAARFDRAPRRGNSVSNDIVRALAAEHDVALLDVEALFRARTPDGILGYELLMDVCHLQPGARPVLMQDMAAALVELNAGR